MRWSALSPKLGICRDRASPTRHMRAALKAQIDKTHRNDARGIAPMMRAAALSSGACEDVAQSKLRMPLTHREPLQTKAIAMERSARHAPQLRPRGRRGWSSEARGADLGAVEGRPDLAALTEPLLKRPAAAAQRRIVHRLHPPASWPWCGPMTFAGACTDGARCRPVVALTCRATVDVLTRFRKSKPVGAVFGTDARQVATGRDRAHWRRYQSAATSMIRRHSLYDGGPRHARALYEMLLARGLGHADRQASRAEDGGRGSGAPAGP